MPHVYCSVISTQSEFKEKNPEDTECVQCIAVSSTGEIQTAYFNGNTDIEQLGNFVRSYVYINEWTVNIHCIQLM